jgi:hypothetical protein
MTRSGQLGLRCIVEPNCSGLSARLASASVIRNCALDTCEPSCVPGAARHFFIPVVHSPLGAVGYVVAPELSSRGGRARSLGTRGRVGAHLGREARSGVEEHVAASKLNSASRRGPVPCDTWQHRSSPQQRGEVRGRGIRDDSEAHLYRKVWSEATIYVTTRECTFCSLS